MHFYTPSTTVTDDRHPASTKKLSFEELEDTLLYFATSITHKDSEEEIAWDLAKNCIARLGLVDCVVYYLIERKKILVQKAAYGPKNPKQYDILSPIDIPLGKGITGTVAETGIAEIIPDTTLDSRYIVDDERRMSEICVPISHSGKVLGVIDCEHPEKNFFTDQHLKILSAIASICAMKISWLRARKRIEAKQQSLIETRQDMAELKIKAIRAQMNPHFIFNALNAIQHFITENNKKASLTYLSLFSKLIRYYLNIIDQERHFLSDEIKMLSWYLQLQTLRYENKVTYTIDQVETIPPVYIPTLIVQLMVEDILENIVMENSGLSHIHLRFTCVHDEITVEASVELPDDKVLIQRVSTYRDGQTPWFEQLIILNRIKKYGIKRSFERISTENNRHIFKWILTLPSLL
jgi:putative methionine-R-sulfoxide reductase with GAF domain